MLAQIIVNATTCVQEDKREGKSLEDYTQVCHHSPVMNIKVKL